MVTIHDCYWNIKLNLDDCFYVAACALCTKITFANEVSERVEFYIQHKLYFAWCQILCHCHCYCSYDLVKLFCLFCLFSTIVW